MTTTKKSSFVVDLRSRGQRQNDSLIKTTIEVDADNDVAAAELAKDRATERFRGRPRNTWRTLSVTQINQEAGHVR